MRYLIITFFLTAGLAATASADEIIFRNGDRITGKIIGMGDGRITIETEAAGSVQADIDQVRTLSSSEPLEIHLVDGAVLVVPVLQSENGLFAVALDGDDLRNVAADDVAAINPPSAEETRWTGDLSIGASFTRGNSHTDDISASTNAVRRSEIDRITFNGSYFYGRQKDVETRETSTSKDSWFVAGKYDFFVSEKIYPFVNSRYEQDRIADLDERFIVGAGLGYQWIERANLAFSTEVGVSWLHEDFDNGTNSEWSGQLGYSFDAAINDKVNFLHTLRYYPAFEGISDFFLTTQAEVRSSLTDAMFASFKVELDHDASPAPGRKRTDLRYLVGVGIGF